MLQDVTTIKVFDSKLIHIFPDKNEINRVTERFYRVKGNEKIEGSGLGLAIILEIMNNHEGVVKIESEEKVGTKVSLIFKRV